MPRQNLAQEEVKTLDSAIVFRFTRAAPGREAQAFDAFTEAQAFFGTKSHDGVCGEPMNFLGTSGNGLMVIPGDYDDLWKLINTDEFLDLYTKTVFALPDISFEVGAYGKGVQDWMARWTRVGGELALI
jgi:hypothetical protein